MKACYLQSINKSSNFTIHSISEILADIKSEKYAPLLAKLPNSQTENKAYKAAKVKLPSWALNGTFKTSIKNNEFESSNGLFHFDIDNRPDVEKTFLDIRDSIPEIYALWRSPSGNGLKGLLRIADDLIHNDSDFKQVFKQVESYFKANGFELDQSCKDVRRLCFVCADKRIFIDTDAKPFDFKPELNSISAKLQPLKITDIPVIKSLSTIGNDKDKQFCITQIEAIFNHASMGGYHDARLRAAKLAGGFVAAGRLSNSEAWACLNDCSNAIHAAHGDNTEVIQRESKALADSFNSGLSQPAESSLVEFTKEQKTEYAQKKAAENLAVSREISEPAAKAIVKIEKAKKPYALYLSDLVTDSKNDYKSAYNLGMIVFSFQMLELLPSELIDSILNDDVRNNKSYKKGKEFAEAESAIYQLWSIDLIIHVYNFNKTHASVLIGGHHRIMRTIPAVVNQDGRESYEFISQNALVTVFQNTVIKTGEKEDKNGDLVDVMQNHIVAWAKHKDCKVYTGGVIFKPLPLNKTIEIKDYFNTWKGFAIEPKAGCAYEIIKEHIEDIVCNGDKELSEYFYNWCAYIFQNPDKPAGAAIVCRGEKGTGKGTIGHFLRMIWGNHGLHISNSNHLTGNFNGHLSDVCFLFADEAYYSANKSHEGVLKALITEPSITIERKGIDAVSQPNYLKVFMATNNDWAVPATKDERRYCVCDVNNLAKGNKEYFDTLHKEVNDPAVQAAFLADMLQRDISDFHTGQIPDTAGLKEQRLHSLDSMGKWLVDSLNNGTFSDSDIWKPEFSSKELYSSYLAWMDSQKTGEYNRFTQTALGKYLTEIGFTKRPSNGIKWNLGTLEAAIFKFECYERVKI